MVSASVFKSKTLGSIPWPGRVRGSWTLYIGGGKQQKLGSAVLWLLAYPGESFPNVPCIAF